MLQLLYKYLILNKKVSVPGLGVFYIHRQPASLDFSNKQFVAPSAQIAFTEGDGVVDTAFYHFLVNEQKVDENSAVASFDGFVAKMKEQLETKGIIQLPRLGTVTKDKAGRLQFTSSPTLTSFYNNVSTERIEGEVFKEEKHSTPRQVSDRSVNEAKIEHPEVEQQHTSTKKDYWWVYAIVIATISAAAIAYYYYQNGSFR